MKEKESLEIRYSIIIYSFGVYIHILCMYEACV